MADILLIGASRGLGLAMASEFVNRGWNVTGTVRGDARTALHELADKQPGWITIECLDITVPDQIESLRKRLTDRRFDVLFVNAGIADTDPNVSAGQVSTDVFNRVMVTNALSPMHVIEGLQELVAADGLIGVMSSGQGSLGNNIRGGNDVYRASKAALNQLMRCHAARHADDARAFVLMAPGWIRTALGGPNAPFSVEEAVPKVVEVVLAQRGRPGLQFLDREGQPVPW
jgi:NAD(P)-dependent dehydrogenase (short-subunit alcohol dehydrogenase family)